MPVSSSDHALNIILQAEDKTAAAVSQAEGRFGKFGKVLGGLSAAHAVLGGAAATAAGFLSDAARAAADDEASEGRLRTAIENSGASFDAVNGKVEERIKLGQSLAFSDDQTRDSLATLTAATGSHEEALKRNKLAMDLARGAHIDLATASMLLGKTDDEHIKGLAKYGINLKPVVVSEQAHKKALEDVKSATLEHDKATQHLAEVQASLHGKTKLSADEQLKLRDAHQKVEDSAKKLTTAQDNATKSTQEGANIAAVSSEIHKRYGGQAEAYGKSTAGAIDKMKDALGEWKESVGKALGPAEPFVAMLPGMQAGFTLAGTALGPLIPKLVGLSVTLFTSVIPAFVATAIAMWPITLTVLAIAGLIALLALAWSHNWGDIQGKTKAVIEVIGTVMTGFIGVLRTIWNTAIVIVTGAIKTVVGVLNHLIDAWNAVAGFLHLPILGHINIDLPNLTWAENQINKTARDRVSNVTLSLNTVAHGKPIPQAEGGSGLVTKPTLFLAGEAGPEYYKFTPLKDTGQTKQQGFVAGAGVMHIHLELDRKEIAHVVLDTMATAFS